MDLPPLVGWVWYCVYAFITLRIRETISEMQMKRWNPRGQMVSPQPPPRVTRHISSMDRNHAGVFPCCWEPPFWNVVQRSFGLTFGPLLWTHSHGVVASQPLGRLLQPWSYTPLPQRQRRRSISAWGQGLWVVSIPQEGWAERVHMLCDLFPA